MYLCELEASLLLLLLFDCSRTVRAVTEKLSKGGGVFFEEQSVRLVAHGCKKQKELLSVLLPD